MGLIFSFFITVLLFFFITVVLFLDKCNSSFATVNGVQYISMYIQRAPGIEVLSCMWPSIARYV